ncbi:hypothetical protein LCGC14_0208820 [marine sediment metagenome]|uniref:Uncharacterized protein n=1 Tax=marine sediment metagenome TaxID=412755 RepID=A0A0F9X0W7_9ZZZZ
MADGDITAVKILYRQSLGGGQNELGVKKNSKILVVGEITCTYVAAGVAVDKTGGDNCFGVTDIDFVKILPLTIAAAYPTAQKLFKADYDVTNKKIFLLEDMGQANPAVPSDADACVLRFVAVGDDADAPELT